MRAFLFVLEITRLQVGRVYANGLPLHCTVLHWFWTDADSHTILKKASEIIRAMPPIPLVAGEEAWFGPSKGPRNILVNLVQTPKVFRELHDQLRSMAEALGATHTEPTYVGDGFHAHVTKQQEGQFVQGSRHLSLATYLIEAIDPSAIAQKHVIARIPHKSADNTGA